MLDAPSYILVGLHSLEPYRRNNIWAGLEVPHAAGTQREELCIYRGKYVVNESNNGLMVDSLYSNEVEGDSTLSPD